MSEDFGLRSFAVLQHLGAADGPHFDFLFDTSDASPLVTFRLPEWPLAIGSTRPALKLRDHRRIYLTYEGQISGDRGHVSRVDEGTVRVTRAGDGAATGAGAGWLLSQPDGRPFLHFESVSDQEWRVTRVE